MAVIFVSYPSEKRHVVDLLRSQLQAHGHEVRYDTNILVAGDDWRKELSEGLRLSDAIVALLAERNSEFVCAEIGAARTYAASKGTLLIPIVVGDFKIPHFIADLNLMFLRDPQDEAFIRGLAVGIDEAVKKHVTRLRGKYPAVFVSHRHKDQQLVSALVDLLTAAFGLDSADVRCTSVHPYTLKAGSRTPDRLKAEIARAKAVLGVVTPDTGGSSYVLFELGAAWGQDVMTFPLLAKGATMEHIPSPISDRHPLKLTESDDCEQLIDDLADVTGWRRNRQAPIQPLISALTAAAIPGAVAGI
jgi:TIR domain